MTTCLILQLICYLSVQAGNMTVVAQGFREKRHQPTLKDAAVSANYRFFFISFGCVFMQSEITSSMEMLTFVVKLIAVAWLPYFRVLDWSRVN